VWSFLLETTLNGYGAMTYKKNSQKVTILIFGETLELNLGFLDML
jgi:hypothetical protein